MMNSSANTEPVFKSVGQALHISFVMEFTPPSSKGSTQLMIEDLMKQRYGEIPVPQNERGINMGGLTPLELRAQCSLVRASVNDHLVSQERDSIYARFGLKYTRALGVRNLRDHFQSLCHVSNPDAILGLLWAIYSPGIHQRHDETAQAFNLRRARRQSEWSLRSLERSYGVGKNALHRDQQMLRKLCHGVEMLAQSKLEEMFVKSELICDPAYR